MNSTPVMYKGLKLGHQINKKDGNFHFAAEILMAISLKTA
jgi:hypothetical protein